MKTLPPGCEYDIEEELIKLVGSSRNEEAANAQIAAIKVLYEVRKLRERLTRRAIKDALAEGE